MCRQFVQCSGESILVTGMTFGEGEASGVTVSAFVVAFLGSVALWWTYFDRTEGLAREVITSSENPGLMVLSAYTYSHVPMIAGILPWSRVVALASLIALVPVGFAMPTLALSGAAGLIVVALAVWETLGYRARVRSPRRSTP